MISKSKYIGEWITASDLYGERIKRKDSHVQFMIRTILRYGNVHKVGNCALEVRLKILNSVVLPVVMYNLETWTKLTNNHEQKLEAIQRKLLCGIYQMNISTPYWGLLAETGMWPIVQYMHYKKLMLYQYILKSENTRIAKIILVGQIKNKYPRCWYMDLVHLSQNYLIDITTERIFQMSKSEWKKEVKEKIINFIDIKHHTYISTKLRFINKNKFGKQEYLEKLSQHDAIQILKIRLNMIEAKENYKNKYRESTICDFCNITDETTEHLFQCKKIKQIIGQEVNINDIYHTDKYESLRKLSFYAKRVEELKMNMIGK